MKKRIAKIALALALATNVASASYINALMYPACGWMFYNMSDLDNGVAIAQAAMVRALIYTKIDGEYFGYMNKLQSIYRETLEQSNAQNELLRQYLALLQMSALQDKKIAFLTNKINQVQGLVTDIEVMEK